MSSVESDLSMFSDNGMIDQGKVIKVIRRVNEDLGLKINKERQAVVEVANNKADLPVDFMFLQIATMCVSAIYHRPGEIFGGFTEEKNCTEEFPVTCNTRNSVCSNECGGKFWVTQTFKDRTVRFKEFLPIRVLNKSVKYCSSHCPNLHNTCDNHIEITDGEIVANFEKGVLYLNYLADMTNEEGEVIILNHPLVRDYYEYAVKKHLLENWMLNSEADVAEKLKYIKQELYESRLRALNFINTIEYSEIQETFTANRKRFYHRYQRLIE